MVSLDFSMMYNAKFEAAYNGRNADTSGVTLVAFYGDGKSILHCFS